MTTTDRRCPNGHSVDASAPYCTQCGARIESIGAPLVCANGHGIAPSDAYCPQCGSPGNPSPFSAASFVAPPPAGYSTAGPYGVGTPGAPQYAPPYPPQYAPPYLYRQPQTTNGLAIASLVVSLVPVCGANAIVALVLGIVALNQIKHTDQGGRGLAIAGIVISAVELALGLTWVIHLVVLAKSGTASSSSIAHLGAWVPR